MDEVQSDGLVENAMGLTGEQTGSESGDKALMSIWNKHNGPEAEMRDPAMPDSFARAEAGGDRFQAAAQWMNLPLETRQMEARAAREFEDRKKQGESLGMKVESAADHRAIQEMLKGGKAPAIDQETRGYLDTMKSVVLDAKSDKEAADFLTHWRDTIQRDPEKGWSELLKAQGMGHLLRDSTVHHWTVQQPEPAVAPYIQKWASKSGATRQDMAEMAEIMSAPSWREIAGESDKSALDRAYKALQRRGTTKHARQGRQLDADLNAIASDIYRD